MFEFLSNFFQEKQIKCFAPIHLADCCVRKPYLLERAGIVDGTAIIFAVPYLTRACSDPDRNISAYAVSRDYHLFFRAFYDGLIPLLKEKFPQSRFVGFADHSPIDEVDAAARAGLGIIGRNHLLLTPQYSSYIFLGEVITDALLPCKSCAPRFCENCGACMLQCPAETCGGCLSALTQKKGALTDAESAAIIAHGTAWGCDLCQSACPHTQKALREGTIFTSVPFFAEEVLSHLTVDALDAMSDEDFSQRAYAWRGRQTIRRNLLLMREKGEPKC